MEKQTYIKGDLLSLREAEELANKGVKVICVDRDNLLKEYLCTVVEGEFKSCTGSKIQGYGFCLRFEKAGEYGGTYASYMKEYIIYEAIEVKTTEDAPKFEFKDKSSVFLKGIGASIFELVCNSGSLESYVNYLKSGRSFYIKGTNLTFSIEDAVEIKDYLVGMIGIAEDSGYFEPKIKMTLAEIEEKLGYKIDLTVEEKK